MGKRYVIESSFWLPIDIESAWGFGSSPKNLAKISPEYLNVVVDHDGPAYEGLEIVIKIKPFFSPIGIEWGSRIENVVSTGDERAFVDVITKGPFKYWKHTHKFTRGTKDVVASGGETLRSLSPGTWFSDHVEYEMPFGVLGQLAHAVAVKKTLQNMFRDRKKYITELLSPSV